MRIAVLENDYLKAVFLPAFGGRLWELWDRTTGENLLYTNDVIRFSNLAVRNAWFSGGVEWNIGIIGHTPLTTDALYVAQTQTDGAPRYFVCTSMNGSERSLIRWTSGWRKASGF